MTQTEALKMALEALEVAKQHIWLGDKAGVEANIKANQTIIFIKEALAQPETPHEIGQRIAKTGGGILQRSPCDEYPAPKSAPDVNQPPAKPCDASAPAP